MKTRKKTTTRPATDAASVEPSQEEIARRAYLVWKREGCPQGQDIVHWQQARAQLLQERKTSQGSEGRPDVLAVKEAVQAFENEGGALVPASPTSPKREN